MAERRGSSRPGDRTRTDAPTSGPRKSATRTSDVEAVLGELEAMGTQRNREVHRRQGAPEPLFGVSLRGLGALRRRIRVDHALARRLWTTGNTDARTLAAMVASPVELSEAEADAWVHEARYHHLVDALASLIARTPYALRKALEWIGSEDEYVGRAGWSLVSRLAAGASSPPDDSLLPLLPQIETGIKAARNRKREGMLKALIAIGGFRAGLRDEALAVAGRIGKVEVDQGEAGRRTPEPAAAIQRAAGRLAPRGRA